MRMSEVVTPFEKLVQEYLDRLRDTWNEAVKSGDATPELSFRPVLHEFFRQLPKTLDIEEIEIIYEPKNQQKAGRPDWKFLQSKTLGIFGYVESKGLDIRKQLELTAHKDQIEKYLGIKHKVILTDGLEFIFFKPDHSKPERFAVIRKPLNPSSKWIAESDPQLITQFLSFFKAPSTREVSDQILMTDLAKRTRLLAEDIEELVSLPRGSGQDSKENQTIDALHALREALVAAHDPGLMEAHKFADTVAQVLVFGLMYAHRYVAPGVDDPKELTEKLRKFWTSAITEEGGNKLRPFRALTSLTENNPQELGPLQTWYLDTIAYLSHVRLNWMKTHSPNYHKLYEQFLSALDPQARVDWGAYATNPYLARFIVQLCEAIAKQEFARSSLFGEDNKIIDPCCGTGIFLEECAKISPKHFVAEVAGFEIQPAPYALAQLRMSLLASEGSKSAKEAEIILCNSLSNAIVSAKAPKIDKHQSAQIKLFEEERAEAVGLATPPVTVVFGNPPSSDAGLHKKPKVYSEILKLLDDFRPPKADRGSRQNIQKQINNDFVKFLRWGLYKLPDDSPAILAFVVPSSFLKHGSYQWARKWILDRFPLIWIIEFDADLRAGGDSSQLFATLQGRCLMVCARADKPSAAKAIWYRTLLDLDRLEKEQFFEQQSQAVSSGRKIAAIDFERIESPPAPYRFKPQKKYDQNLYESFFRLCPIKKDPSDRERYVFLRHTSGLKIGATAAFIHKDKQQLVRKIRDLGQKNYAELKEKWFKGQQKPPAESALSASLRTFVGDRTKKTSPSNEIVRYSFRPFVETFFYCDVPTLEKLAKQGGGGGRRRPEVLAAYGKMNNFGISVAPGPENIGDELHRFASFTWHLPDNDLCTRGNSHVFCVSFPEYKKAGKKWDANPKLNLNPNLIKRYTGHGFGEAAVTELIVYYVYAVLSAPAYLGMFEGALYATAGDWPRIPFPEDSRIFHGIAGAGQELAGMERDQDEVNLNENELKRIKQLTDKEFWLDDFDIEPEVGALQLIGDDGIYRVAYIGRSALSMEISRYNPLEQWLKWHRAPYLNRKFSYEDAKRLSKLLTRLEDQVFVIARVNKLVEQLLDQSVTKLI
jgi:hypothetical protein